MKYPSLYWEMRFELLSMSQSEFRKRLKSELFDGYLSRLVRVVYATDELFVQNCQFAILQLQLQKEKGQSESLLKTIVMQAKTFRLSGAWGDEDFAILLESITTCENDSRATSIENKPQSLTCD